MNGIVLDAVVRCDLPKGGGKKIHDVVSTEMRWQEEIEGDERSGNEDVDKQSTPRDCLFLQD